MDKSFLEYVIVFGLMGSVVFGWLVFDVRDGLLKFLCFLLAATCGLATFAGSVLMDTERPKPPRPAGLMERKPIGPPVILTPDGKIPVIVIEPEKPAPIPVRPVPPVVDDEGNVLPEYLDENGNIKPMIIINGKVQPTHPWATDDSTLETDEADPDVVITPEPDPSEYGRTDGWQ